MALPVTISAVAASDTIARRMGPFISSGGNVYVVLLDSADKSLIEVHKATDPETSFAEADSADKPNLTNTVMAFEAVQDSDVIHIAALETVTGRLSYHTFNMATDQWVVVNEQVVASTLDDSFILCSIAEVRSDGDVIVLYAGAAETVTMSSFHRAKYARREGGSWTVNVAVDNGGAADWTVGCVVRGSSDRMHFFFLNDTADDAYQRCLRSDNAFETFPSAFDTAVQSSAGEVDLGMGVAYVSGATTKIRVPYFDASGLTMAQCDSADTPTMSTLAYSTAFAHRRIDQYILATAAKQTDLYALWVDDTSKDLIRDVNADGAGWGTDTSTFTGTVNWVSPNVFVRGGNYKLAYVIDDAGAVKYNELDLGAAAAAFLPTQPPPVSQAVKRAATF